MPKTLSPADIDAFRSRLCDVAEKLFAAKGPEGVTIRELAEALGVSAMTPYRYFEDKDAILAAVRTRAFNRFAQAMEAAALEAMDRMTAAQAPSMRQKKRVKAASPATTKGETTPKFAYLDFAIDNPAAYRLMFDIDQPTAETYPDLVAAMERARLTMSVGLRQLAAAGKFKGDVELSAHILWSALHGAVMLELAGLLNPPLDARALARPTIAMLMKAMGLAAD